MLRIAAQAAVFISAVLLSRLLGPEAFGDYTFLFSGYLLFVTLLNVQGLNEVLVREMASRPEKREKIYSNGLALKMMAGGMALAVGLAVAVVYPWEGIAKWTAIAACGTLVFSFSTSSMRMVWDVPYQVDFRMISASTINLISKAIFLALLALWWLGFLNGISVVTGSLALAVLMQIFSEAVGTGIHAGVNVRNGYSMKPAFHRQTAAYLIKESAPLLFAGAVTMVLAKGNILLLQSFRSSHELGIYAVPMRLVDALLIIPTVFTAGFLPLLAQADARELRRLTRLGFRLMLGLSIPIAVVVTFWAREIILLFFGETFLASAPVIRILVWQAAAAFGMIALHNMAVAVGLQGRLTLLYSVQAALSLALNLFAIANWGVIGAAWAHLANYLLLIPLSFTVAGLRPFAAEWLRALAIPVIASLLLGLIIRQIGSSLFLAAVAVPVAFTVTMFGARWVTLADLTHLKAVMTAARTVKNQRQPPMSI